MGIATLNSAEQRRSSFSTYYATLTILARALLVLGSYVACAAYLVWIVAQLLPDWYKGKATAWADMKALLVVPYSYGKQQELLSGSNALAFVMGWLPILAASIAVCLLAMINSVAAPLPRRNSAAKNWVKKVLLFQLPPRGLLWWWCDGLTVIELLVVLAWLGMHAMGIVIYADKYIKRNDVIVAGLDKAGVIVSDSSSMRNFFSVAMAFGQVLLFDLAFLFFPISRSSFVNYLTGMSYQALIRYHRWIGHSTMIMLCCHGGGYWLYWAINSRIVFWSEMTNWNVGHSVNFLAGNIAFMFALTLWISAADVIRRNHFRVFYKLHVVGFLGFVTFAVLHYDRTWQIITPALVVYALDIAYRMFQAKQAIVGQAETSPKGKIITLQFAAEKGCQVAAQQEVFICVPSISRWQYHPFSVGAVHHDGQQSSKQTTFKVYIKIRNRWTKELAAFLEQGFQPTARILGPYSSIGKSSKGYWRSTKWHSYSSLLLVAGGIAVTTLRSMLQEVMENVEAYTLSGREEPQVTFVFITRDTDELSVLDRDFLEQCMRQSGWLELQIYFTGHEEALALQGTGHSHKTGLLRLSSTAAPAQPRSYSAFGLKAGNAMCPRQSSQMELAWATICAFAGGFFGIVLALSFAAEHKAAKQRQQSLWQIRIVLCVCFAVGAIGLPVMLALVPTYCIELARKHWMARKAGVNASARQDCSDGVCAPQTPEAAKSATVVTTKLDDSTTCSTPTRSPPCESQSGDLPVPRITGSTAGMAHGTVERSATQAANAGHGRSVLAGDDSARGLENRSKQVSWKVTSSEDAEDAISVPVLLGRPDIPQLIQRTSVNAGAAPSFAVFGAGPPSLMQGLHRETARYNDAFTARKPFADFYKEAWEL